METVWGKDSQRAAQARNKMLRREDVFFAERSDFLVRPSRSDAINNVLCLYARLYTEGGACHPLMNANPCRWYISITEVWVCVWALPPTPLLQSLSSGSPPTIFSEILSTRPDCREKCTKWNPDWQYGIAPWEQDGENEEWLEQGKHQFAVFSDKVKLQKKGV